MWSTPFHLYMYMVHDIYNEYRSFCLLVFRGRFPRARIEITRLRVLTNGSQVGPQHGRQLTDDKSMVVLRYIFRGESLRNGRVILLEQPPAAAALRGELIFEALYSDDANVPRAVVPFFYDRTLQGWRKLHSTSEVAIGDEGRIEVLLEAPANPVASDNHSSRRPLATGAVAVVGDEATALDTGMSGAASDAGYYGIGIYNSKTGENVGTLWRSAYMLDARFIFTIGSRNHWEKSADTHKAWRTVPAFRYEDFAGFCASAPYQCTWVAVEMGGTPLHDFEHPDRAVYFLGAEDAGLPPAIVRACHRTVSLEGVRASSYNVSVAGSLIMYDRLRKRQRPHACAGDGAADGQSAQSADGDAVAPARPRASESREEDRGDAQHAPTPPSAGVPAG
jgi:tRNA(Leu) C34 or U34 (ribose-2'-O)-methylase TrmL